MPSIPFTIRQASRADLASLARLGAGLARMHHRLDRRRFFTVPQLEEGYAWWLGKERRSRKAVVLAAVDRDRRGQERVIGYAYGRIEPRNWNSLRESCGMGIDLAVEPRARRRGVGRALVEALAAELSRRGAPRLVIEVASRNPRAHAVFARMGFRPTVVEYTRELGRPRPPRRTMRSGR